MTSISSPKGVEMIPQNASSDDPNTWTKSKKKRMRQKRKKMEEATSADAQKSTRGDDRGNSTDNNVHNKRRKVNSPEPSAVKSQPDGHTNTNVTASNPDVSPSKSPKKKKKKKKQKQSNELESSPLQKEPLTAVKEQSPTTQSTKEQNQATKPQPTKPKPFLMSTLQKSFLDRLTSSRFRELNEELYTQPSQQSFAQFTSNPDLFEQYHSGFRRQVEEWPVNPVNVIYKKIVGGYKRMMEKRDDTAIVVADFGCGDAKLAERLLALQLDENGNLSPKRPLGKKNKRAKSGVCPFTVHSFDLVSGGNPLVTPADMTNVPLASESVDIGVYCLALMGTNVPDFVREGWRVLKFGGMLKVAEVRSRFEACADGGRKVETNRNGNKRKNVHVNDIADIDSTKPLMILDDFKSLMERCGFRCTNVDQSNKMFLFMEFVKVEGSNGLSGKETFSAKPCIYKRR